MQSIRHRVPMTVAALVLAIIWCFPLCARQETGIPLQFDSFQGLFAGFSGTTLNLEMPDGLQSFRILRAGETVSVLGKTEGTSISVVGKVPVDFLKRGMTIRFDAEEDKQLRHQEAVESIQVLATSGRHAHSKEPMLEIDEATGTSLYRWTVQVEQLKSDQKALFVLLNEGSVSQRLSFPVDLEKTVVEYDLPDLRLAEPGDAVAVRALVVPVGKPMAVEVSIDRSQPPAGAPGLAADAGGNPPNEAAAPPSDMAKVDKANETAEANETEEAAEPVEGEVFDFNDPNPAPVSPDSVPMARGHDPADEPDRAAAIDWTNPPRPRYSFPPPKADQLRLWYKIN
jgi:hypothetical protein